jgi:hypothetical protein
MLKVVLFSAIALLLAPTIVNFLIHANKLSATVPLQQRFSVQDFNHSLWDALLKTYVSHGTLGGISLNVVDYIGIRKDARLDTYLNLLSQWPTYNLSRNEEMALYINAYNAYTVKTVADHPCKVRFGRFCYPTKSIWDIGTLGQSVWEMKLAAVGGKEFSLDEIEGYLRSNFSEPKIHACLVCASVSCPDLRLEAYEASKLSAQMNDQMTSFLANPNKGFALDESTETIYVSNIFNWYENDFNEYMKKFYNGTVLDFIITNVPKQYQTYLLRHQLSLTVNYFNYNWRLNSLISTNSIVRYRNAPNLQNTK